MSLRHLTVKDILAAHEVVAENSKVRTSGLKGSQEEGLRKISEVLRDARKEDNIYMAAAAYFKELIDNHPFNDGNKRTAITVVNRFLQENGEEFQPHKIQNSEELYQTIKWEVPSMSREELAHWIKTGEI